MARRYPDFFQDENIVFRKTFFSDDTGETPIDPSTVVFKIKSPSGTTTTPSVTNEPGAGEYSATKIADEYGVWSWRWITTDPVIVDQGFINIIEKNI